jgi:polysaccharide deacetylase 2 family uncharacterized protein YibQ
MAGRLISARSDPPRRLRSEDDREGKARFSAWTIAAASAGLACAAFVLIVSILWLLAADGDRSAARSVVVALTPSIDEPAPTRPAPEGLEGGLVVPATTAAAFGRVPPLAPSEAPLAPAPDPALIESTAVGALPVIAADGRLPRRVYARPHDQADWRAKLAIIVAGVGLSNAASEAAIERLPGAVVLAIDAYADRPDAWAGAARRAGHELLAMVPLQEEGSSLHDRGPRALRASLSTDENGRRLEAMLGAFAGYVGVLAVGATPSHPNEGAFAPLLATARSRGLLLVDGTEGKEGSPLWKTGRLAPVLGVDIVIGPAGAPAIDRQLADLEKIAGERSSGIALVQAYPTTLERLRAWMSALDAGQYVLAPISAMVDAERAH